VYLRRVIEEWPRCYSPQSTGAKCRSDLRGWIIYSWIALPTVMHGGYPFSDWHRSSWTPFPLRKSGDVKGAIRSHTQHLYQGGIKRCPPTPFDISLSTDYESLGIRSFPEVFWRSGASVRQLWPDFSELPGSGGAGHRFAAIGQGTSSRGAWHSCKRIPRESTVRGCVNNPV
jgi:hypothetical protein